jgi:hypothetical protein
MRAEAKADRAEYAEAQAKKAKQKLTPAEKASKAALRAAAKDALQQWSMEKMRSDIIAGMETTP